MKLCQVLCVNIQVKYKILTRNERIGVNNKMYERRTRSFFPEQECDPVTVLV